jgi:SAM-dependent methyltransferase
LAKKASSGVTVEQQAAETGGSVPQDQINWSTWTQTGAVNWLSSNQGYTDRGEFAAYWRIADQVREKPILDLGVGGGRTISLLRPLSRDYVAIEYLPPLVEAAQRRYPFVDIRQGDARDLSQFEDGRFGLVVFSYAGIDAVGPEDRRRILSEASRVLKPGGIFWFSTLNKDGRSPSDRPWRPRWREADASPVRNALELLRHVRSMPRSLANYARLQKLRRDGDGWLVAPFSPHAFGLLVHYTTLKHQIDELVRAGFEPTPEVFAPEGTPVPPDADLRAMDFFNIVARKRQA